MRTSIPPDSLRNTKTTDPALKTSLCEAPLEGERITKGRGWCSPPAAFPAAARLTAATGLPRARFCRLELRRNMEETERDRMVAMETNAEQGRLAEAAAGVLREQRGEEPGSRAPGPPERIQSARTVDHQSVALIHGRDCGTRSPGPRVFDIPTGRVIDWKSRCLLRVWGCQPDNDRR